MVIANCRKIPIPALAGRVLVWLSFLKEITFRNSENINMLLTFDSNESAFSLLETITNSAETIAKKISNTATSFFPIIEMIRRSVRTVLISGKLGWRYRNLDSRESRFDLHSMRPSFNNFADAINSCDLSVIEPFPDIPSTGPISMPTSTKFFAIAIHFSRTFLSLKPQSFNSDLSREVEFV